MWQTDSVQTLCFMLQLFISENMEQGTQQVVFSLQERFCTLRLSSSLCSILGKGPVRLLSLGFCCAKNLIPAGLITSLLLQEPPAPLRDCLVLDRMPHALGKLLSGCRVFGFAAECWEVSGNTSAQQAHV